MSNLAALNFSEKLYQSLAVGLSLDEALTFARVSIAETEHSYYECDWSRFMAYMPTESAVLFPRSDTSAIRRRQQKVRTERAQTIEGLAKAIDKMDRYTSGHSDRVATYATYLARCSTLFAQTMLVLRLEILVANEFGARLPL